MPSPRGNFGRITSLYGKKSDFFKLRIISEYWLKILHKKFFLRFWNLSFSLLSSLFALPLLFFSMEHFSCTALLHLRVSEHISSVMLLQYRTFLLIFLSDSVSSLEHKIMFTLYFWYVWGLNTRVYMCKALGEH